MKTPHGYNAATNRLKTIFGHLLEIRRIRGSHADEIQAIQDALAKAIFNEKKQIEPHIQAIKEHLLALTRWYRLNLDRYGQGRTLKLPDGQLTAQLSSQFKVDITGNEEDVIERLAKKSPEYVIVTRSPNKSAIARDRELFRGFKGIEISLTDNLRAEPVAFEPDKTEKQLLSVVLKIWKNPRIKPEGRRAKGT